VSKKILVIAAIAVASSWAGAQTVWRCGNSYSQQPCEGGTAIAPSTSRPASSDAAAATRVANVDAKLAADLEKARLARERNAPKAIIIGPQTPASAPVVKTVKEASKAKPGKPEQFTAIAPGSAKKKAKKKG
jgi:hypothetical protein